MSKKKTKTTEEVKAPVEKKTSTKCYTFKDNLFIGGDTYMQGQRIALDKKGYEELKPYVVLTSDYKWPTPDEKTMKQHCKNC